MSSLSQKPVTLPAVTVYPLRFTADAPAMIAFLRTLGMAPVPTSTAIAHTIRAPPIPGCR